MTLTNEQLKIVHLNKGNHLVIAPPGTGKTEILTQRVFYHLNNFLPNEMICLTFTNRAALNMKKRIQNSDIFIGNIHSFCEMFLKKEKLVSNNVSIIDEVEVEHIIKEINTLNLKIYELKTIFVILKMNELNFSDELKPNLKLKFKLTTSYKTKLRNLYNQYETIKKESNFIDFDDLLILTYKFFMDNPDYKSTYKWVQIDEVQDLNLLQWKIIEKIRQNAHNVYFGDYEQTIFSFIGASNELIKQFTKNFQIHTLTKNFRTDSLLVDLLQEYKKLNIDENSFNFVSTNKDKGEFFIKKFKNIKEEINWIINNALKDKFSKSAILFRTNKQVEVFESYLKNSDKSYLKVSGFDLFQRKEVKDLFAILSLFVNQKDKISLIRVFHIFTSLHSLKESRIFVNNLFRLNITPFELIKFETALLDIFYNSFFKRVVIFDTETTGLDIQNDDVIQIGAIEVINGKITKKFDTYIMTDKDISSSKNIHNISKEKLNTPKKEAFIKFKEFIKDSLLIAHNVKFDINILNSNLERVGIEKIENLCLDSIEITKKLFPDLKSYKLETLIKEFQIEGKNSHNAIDDVFATYNLLSFLSDTIKNSWINDYTIFYNEYKKIIDKFITKFKSIYFSIFNQLQTKNSLYDTFLFLIEYLQTNLNYKIDIEEINKILKHMKKSCEDKTLQENLRKCIPMYKRFKEVDLITGDEEIIISTIHKAKGLEWDNVIIPHCNSDIYPLYTAKTITAKKEEARLLYVGLSRAKKRILITFVKNFRVWISPFIYKLYEKKSENMIIIK